MNNIKTLTVYLGSSGHARPVFKTAAETLGRLIGSSGKALVYGGMDAGLMGILALNALQAGGHVTGIVPRKLQDSERILGNLSQTILVNDLWDRKKQMFLMADATITLPGGFGTLDESLEMLYWAGLNYHRKPLVLVNIEGYWTPIVQYLKTLPDFNARYLIVVDTVEEAIPALNIWAIPGGDFKTPEHLPHFEDEISRSTSEPIFIDHATLENSYYVICALGLKQLGKHTRAIGLFNKDGQFDDLQKWFLRAAEETFITPKCLKLYAIDDQEERLREALKAQINVEIDLHREKWGPRNTAA
jgi:uncharacterized protein (TIGR00730 family)